MSATSTPQQVSFIVRPGSYVNYWPTNEDTDYPRCRVVEVIEGGLIVDHEGQHKTAGWSEIGIAEGDMTPSSHKPDIEADCPEVLDYDPTGEDFEPMDEQIRKRHEYFRKQRGEAEPKIVASRYGMQVKCRMHYFVPIGARVGVMEGACPVYRGTVIGGGEYGPIVLTDENGPQLVAWDEITPEAWIIDAEEYGPEPSWDSMQRFRAAYSALRSVWYSSLANTVGYNPLGDTDTVSRVMAATVHEAGKLWATAPVVNQTAA